jgi:hypothetical protein
MDVLIIALLVEIFLNSQGAVNLMKRGLKW